MGSTVRSRNTSTPVTTTVRSAMSREKFSARARLMDEVRRAEYQFTRRPSHDNAATLAGLRAGLTQIELEIVNLDLAELVGE